MSSQTLARLIAMRICEHYPRDDDDVEEWINEHWELIAAQYEAGLIDQEGEPTAEYSDAGALAAVERWFAERDVEGCHSGALAGDGGKD